jgi:hypothetical protein
MRLTDKVTVNFNNIMFTSTALLDIEQALETTWHTGLRCKLSDLQFSTSLIKLIASTPIAKMNLKFR